MSIFEYNEKAERRVIMDEAYEEGEATGIAKSILVILEKKGSVPEELRAEILKEKDIKVLGAGWMRQSPRKISGNTGI